jgi:3-deoxy-D-manno-octulosonic-acid transferase
MFFLYTVIYIFAASILLPFEFLKRPRGLRWRWLREKLGFFNSKFKINPPEIIWIHAVSVGEVMAALPLISRLNEKFPLKEIVLSTITDTGQKVARERVSPGTSVVYLPFDIPFVLYNVLRKLRPELLIIMETELWPNMIRIFNNKGIPVILLNGRISDKSFKGYKKICFFMKRVLSCIDFFGMQTTQYAERIIALGVSKSRVAVAGNFKFDTRPPDKIPLWTDLIRGPIIVAGSTHEGEEELMISVYSQLKKDSPDLNLVIAPRHPERFLDVDNLLKSKDISFIRRSTIGSPSQFSDLLHGIVILLDTIGELSSIYGKADIAVIGKSFRGYGGQNPLEPAYWGKPIICGPHMENFPVIKELYIAGAAIEVSEDHLYSEIRGFLEFPEKANVIGLKAKKFHARNAGAAERALEVIEEYVKGDRNKINQ